MSEVDKIKEVAQRCLNWKHTILAAQRRLPDLTKILADKEKRLAELPAEIKKVREDIELCEKQIDNGNKFIALHGDKEDKIAAATALAQKIDRLKRELAKTTAEYQTELAKQ